MGLRFRRGGRPVLHLAGFQGGSLSAGCRCGLHAAYGSVSGVREVRRDRHYEHRAGGRALRRWREHPGRADSSRWGCDAQLQSAVQHVYARFCRSGHYHLWTEQRKRDCEGRPDNRPLPDGRKQRNSCGNGRTGDVSAEVVDDREDVPGADAYRDGSRQRSCRRWRKPSELHHRVGLLVQVHSELRAAGGGVPRERRSYRNRGAQQRPAAGEGSRSDVRHRRH